MDTGKGQRAKYGPSADIDWPVMRWYLLLILAAFTVLTVQLFQLQVLNRKSYKLKSLDNIIRPVQTPPRRGDIYDRAGSPLAVDENVFALLYIPPTGVNKYFLENDELDLLKSITDTELGALAALEDEKLKKLQTDTIRPFLSRLNSANTRELGLLKQLATNDQYSLRELPLWAIESLRLLSAKQARELLDTDGDEIAWLNSLVAENLGLLNEEDEPATLPQGFLRALSRGDLDAANECIEKAPGWLSQISNNALIDPAGAAGSLKAKYAEARLAIPVELSWLNELLDDQLDLIITLDAEQRKALLSRSGTQFKMLQTLIDSEITSLYAQDASAATAVRLDTGESAAWLNGMSLRELYWLSHIPANIGKLHPSIVGQIRTSGNEPFLHRLDGNRLEEINDLATALKIPYTELMARIEKESSRVFGYQPLTIIDALNTDQLVYLGEHSHGSRVWVDRYACRRTYPLGRIAAHLIGYTGLINDEDPEPVKSLGFGPRERVGKDGAELSYEELLHGTAGSMDIEVDKNRVFVGISNVRPPVKGNDVVLTINAKVQSKAYEVMRERPGAIIVASIGEGFEGEIICLVSSPGFDYSKFNDEGYYESLLRNPDLPLINRAYRHAFAPGSTFKLVTGTAALQERTCTGGSGFYCNGFIELGRNKRRYHCHNRTGHGSVSFLEAISESCDVAFYDIALNLSDNPPDTLKRYAERFGYGSILGLDLPGEVTGLLPDKAWKRRNYSWANEVDRLWYDGDTCNYSIGQGFLTSTPLQVLWSAYTVAASGVTYPPKLLKDVLENNESVLRENNRPVRHALDAESLAIVEQGMRLAVTAGTCRKLNIGGMEVCAKSGTAETLPGEKDHSWVVGYYPRSKPEYAFVVFFQNGGGAGEAAVPAAHELLVYMKDNPPIDKASLEVDEDGR